MGEEEDGAGGAAKAEKPMVPPIADCEEEGSKPPAVEEAPPRPCEEEKGGVWEQP